MSRLRDESGFTLVEILASLAIFSIVLAATLNVLDGVQRQTTDERARFDSRDQVRTAVDRVVRPLRAAVKTTNGMVESPGASDLVYDVVGPTAPGGSDPNTKALQRVRVCLDAAGRIYRQTKAYTSKDPPALTSPGCGLGVPTDYDNAQVIAANVSNAARPLFTYDYKAGSTAPADIQGIKVSLWVDANGPARAPGESDLSTAVSLRNANRPPIASFSTAVVNGHLLTDATSAVDPEGGALTYSWSLVTSPGGASVSGGSGANIRWDKPGLTNNASYTVTLTVTDPAGATDSLAKTITMPS